MKLASYTFVESNFAACHELAWRKIENFKEKELEWIPTNMILKV